MNHGFVRAPDGTFTTFDVLGSGTGPGQGTLPQDINEPGVINGDYIDASGVLHGFLRDKHGTITTFDAPGAGTASGQGTFPTTLNPSGAMTGYYQDASGVLFTASCGASKPRGEPTFGASTPARGFPSIRPKGLSMTKSLLRSQADILGLGGGLFMPCTPKVTA